MIFTVLVASVLPNLRCYEAIFLKLTPMVPMGPALNGKGITIVFSFRLTIFCFYEYVVILSECVNFLFLGHFLVVKDFGDDSLDAPVVRIRDSRQSCLVVRMYFS